MIFLVPIEKEVKKKLVKMEKKLQKSYLTDYDIFIAQNLWQAHYQILLMILLKEFIKLNVNTDMIIKNKKREELDIKIVSAVLNTHKC